MCSFDLRIDHTVKPSETTIANIITMNKPGLSEIRLNDKGLTCWMLGSVTVGETVGFGRAVGPCEVTGYSVGAAVGTTTMSGMYCVLSSIV